MPVLWFLVAVAMCFLVSSVAQRRGLNSIPYVILAVFFWPLALILVYVARPDAAGIERYQAESLGMRKCPACAEMIKTEAKVCRFCGHGRTDSSAAGKPRDAVAQMEADDLERFRRGKRR